MSTERLIHLVNEMLDVSRIESGRIQMHVEPFDFAALLDEVKEEFSPRAVESGLTFTLDVKTPLPAITGDKEKFHQVMENLVGNSFKYTPKDGTVTVRAEPSGEGIHVTVSDTGPGIRSEDIPKLFTKFGRLENSPVTGGSTGLGLYITKQYIEMHKGKIWIESVVGHGASFHFIVPTANGLQSTPAE